MKYLKTFESISNVKDILNYISVDVSLTFPHLNHSGTPLCTMFALKIKELLCSDCSLVHFFGEDDDYNKELNDHDGDNSPFNSHRYYFAHTSIDIYGELYDSNGFTTKQQIIEKYNLINPIVLKDEMGSFVEKIYDMEEYIEKEDRGIISDIDSIIKKHSNI